MLDKITKPLGALPGVLGRVKGTWLGPGKLERDVLGQLTKPLGALHAMHPAKALSRAAMQS